MITAPIRRKAFRSVLRSTLTTRVPSFEQLPPTPKLKECNVDFTVEDFDFENAFKEHRSSTDIRGRKLVTKRIGNNKNVYYDYGYKEMFRVNRTLEYKKTARNAIRLLQRVNREIAKDFNSMNEESQKKLSIQDLDYYRKKIMADENKEQVDVIMRIFEANLKFSDSVLVPEPVNDEELIDSDYEDPNQMSLHDLSTRVLQDAHKRALPVRGRVLNIIKQGLTVAVGSILGFAPSSQLLPSIIPPKDPYMPRYEQWKEWAPCMLGREMWFVVLDLGRDSHLGKVSPVLSHKAVPHRSFLLPELQELIENELQKRRKKAEDLTGQLSEKGSSMDNKTE